MDNEITEKLEAEPAGNPPQNEEQVILQDDRTIEDDTKPLFGLAAHTPTIIEKTSVSFELLLWIVIALIPPSYTFLSNYLNPPLIPAAYFPGYALRVTVPSLFYSVVVLMIPFLSKQIFGEYPVSALRRAYSARGEALSALSASTASSMGVSRLKRYIDQTTTPGLMRAGAERQREDPRALLSIFSEDSSRLAERIYFRAGAYLMAGAVIAFSGLGIFAYIRATPLHVNQTPIATTSSNATTQARPEHIPALGQEVTPSPATGRGNQPLIATASSNETTQAQPEISQAHEGVVDRIFDLIPGVGILFFIEFVALFFFAPIPRGDG